jgi:hypothetical protein
MMTTNCYSGNHCKSFQYLLIVLSALFFVFSSFSEGVKTNFSGKWKFNESKSELDEGRFRGAASQLTVSQNENELQIDRLYIRSSGEEFTSTEKLTLDGKECINIVFRDRERKSTAVWSDDKKTINISSVMVFEREGEQMTINTTEIWSLSDDGKNLTIDYTSVSSRGERKNKFVYDKE